ncbi:MAG: hypothetical protein JO061_10885 [Acidobacteriaceae bacterium]|nr:hypothetical protein [Acidobacteriaceae bacterium]
MSEAIGLQPAPALTCPEDFILNCSTFEPELSGEELERLEKYLGITQEWPEFADVSD